MRFDVSFIATVMYGEIKVNFFVSSQKQVQRYNIIVMLLFVKLGQPSGIPRETTSSIIVYFFMLVPSMMYSIFDYDSIQTEQSTRCQTWRSRVLYATCARSTAGCLGQAIRGAVRSQGNKGRLALLLQFRCHHCMQAVFYLAMIIMKK